MEPVHTGPGWSRSTFKKGSCASLGPIQVQILTWFSPEPVNGEAPDPGHESAAAYVWSPPQCHTNIFAVFCYMIQNMLYILQISCFLGFLLKQGYVHFDLQLFMARKQNHPPIYLWLTNYSHCYSCERSVIGQCWWAERATNFFCLLSSSNLLFSPDIESCSLIYNKGKHQHGERDSIITAPTGGLSGEFENGDHATRVQARQMESVVVSNQQYPTKAKNASCG